MPSVGNGTIPIRSVHQSGSECIAHVAQASTDMDANASLLSVDGIAPFDLVSRGAVRSLVEVEGGVLPFVRQLWNAIHILVGRR